MPVGWKIRDKVQRRRNQSSAELDSAVSRICNPLRVLSKECLAECNSAIQQIQDLRCVLSGLMAEDLPMGW